MHCQLVPPLCLPAHTVPVAPAPPDTLSPFLVFCQLSDSVYFDFVTVTVQLPGLGLSAPVPTYVCPKGSTMMTCAKLQQYLLLLQSYT